MTRHAPVIFTALTLHDRFWLDVIRVASNDTDPAPTLERTQQLRRIFSSDSRPFASSSEHTHGR